MTVQTEHEKAALRHLLICADSSDLWQEEDGTTREYNHREFGFSDFVSDQTELAEQAASLGLVELRGKWRRWALTEAGERWLAENGEQT